MQGERGCIPEHRQSPPPQTSCETSEGAVSHYSILRVRTNQVANPKNYNFIKHQQKKSTNFSPPKLFHFNSLADFLC